MIVVRDTAGGIEISMVRRHPGASFAGGAHVFPGGSLDATDRSPGPQSLACGLDDARASAILGIPDGGLAYWMAAIRECFEEVGLLFAHRAPQVPGDAAAAHAPCRVGRLVSFDDPAEAQRFGARRRALNDGTTTLEAICREEGLHLAVGELVAFSHWITPVEVPRRFDTRFFVARAPRGQVPFHDEGETVDSEWITPAEVLRRRNAGEIDVILPTARNVEAVGRFSTVAALLASARAQGPRPAIQPRIVAKEGEVRIVVPGEEGEGELQGSPPFPLER